jgi:formyltetrahydrofolate synthetase
LAPAGVAINRFIADTEPGPSKVPAAEGMAIKPSGEIVGLS